MLSTTTLTGNEIWLLVIAVAGVTTLLVAGIYELIRKRDDVDRFVDGFFTGIDLVKPGLVEDEDPLPIPDYLREKLGAVELTAAEEAFYTAPRD